MHARSIRLTIAVLFAVPAWGQVVAGQNVSQVFHFSYSQQPVYMQQLVNAIRTIGETTQSSVNFDDKTLTVNGTPAQIATAAWMFATLTNPRPPVMRPRNSGRPAVSTTYCKYCILLILRRRRVSRKS